jgi:hypothetical protein
MRGRRTELLFGRKPLIIILLAVVILVSVLVEIPHHPPRSTRVILDHSLQTIIAPPCFEQAEFSNNLSESTLENAQKKQYMPESVCTEYTLASEDKTLLQIILEKTGAKRSRWDW